MLSKNLPQNIVLVDEVQIDKILEQLPKSASLLESLKASVSFSIKIAKFEMQAV
jgi:hypothetical protein